MPRSVEDTISIVAVVGPLAPVPNSLTEAALGHERGGEVSDDAAPVGVRRIGEIRRVRRVDRLGRLGRLHRTSWFVGADLPVAENEPRFLVRGKRHAGRRRVGFDVERGGSREQERFVLGPGEKTTLDRFDRRLRPGEVRSWSELDAEVDLPGDALDLPVDRPL